MEGELCESVQQVIESYRHVENENSHEKQLRVLEQRSYAEFYVRM